MYESRVQAAIRESNESALLLLIGEEIETSEASIRAK
jgi:hypothetical protein